MKERKYYFLLPILSGMVVVLAALCCILWLGKSKAERASAEYKAAYDVLLEENRQTKYAAEEYKSSYDHLLEENHKAEEERKNASLLTEDYQAKYDKLVNDILEDAILAEKMGNLIVSVWHNAIWKCQDEETDKYTMSGGLFVSDFNDALKNLFDDEDFSGNISVLLYHQFLVRDAMKEMLKPPDGFENAFNALESLYNSYLSFTDIVINCKGSLESFSNDFSDADRDLSRKYDGAALYTKY